MKNFINGCLNENRNMLSILITHYNRSAALKDCLEAIRTVDFPYEYEIVISDDGSTLEHLDNIKKFKYDQLLLSKYNQGLTNNINKGLKACKGTYILYCQEDFLLDPQIALVLDDCMKLIERNVLDMIRLTANYKFNSLNKLTAQVSKIPTFSIDNFNINTFRYSDNPFITTISFYDKFGYYLEDVSGAYGETEYAIRILKLGARIGITNKSLAKSNADSISVMKTFYPSKKRKVNRILWRLARALRQHIEWLFYNPKKRRLLTYKNQKSIYANSHNSF